MSLAEKLFGSFSDRELKKINPIAKQVLALLAALAAVGAWKYTNGNFYALPEQLRALLTEHVPRPGATLV